MSAEELNSKIQRVLMLHKNGQIADAIAGYRDLIPIVPPQIQLSLHGNLGALLMAEGEYEAARDSFASAVAISPNHASSQYNLAVLLTSKFNQHAKALKHCALAIRADPSAHKAYHLMGNIMQNLGKHAEASKYFEQAEALAQQHTTPSSTSSSSAAAAPTTRNWADLLGYKLRPGEVRQHVIAGETYSVECLSSKPLVLSVENLLPAEACAEIIRKAQPLLEKSFVMGNSQAVLADGQSREAVEEGELYRSSYSAWLPRDAALSALQHTLAALLGMPLAYIQHKSEDLQVVKYDLGGQFKAHQDSSSFHPRLFSALLYLNDLPEGYAGGETWFPFADSDESLLQGVGIEEAVHRALDIYETAASHGDSGVLPGLKVTPKTGKAVIFFNYDMETAELSPYAIHAGLPVRTAGVSAIDEGEVKKWVANYWVENNPSLLTELLQGSNS
eukprot:gene32319-39086_t